MTNYIGEKIAAGAQLEEYVTERMVALQISGLDRSDYSHKTIIIYRMRKLSDAHFGLLLIHRLLMHQCHLIRLKGWSTLTLMAG